MKIFVDANLLVAVLNRQYPLFTYAARILSLAGTSRYEIYTSPICLAIAFYFAEKKCGSREAKKKIAILSEKLKITATDSEVVRLAAKNPAIHDFEDGLEYYSALQMNCDVIVTEDISDFYFAEIPVCNSNSFLDNMK